MQKFHLLPLRFFAFTPLLRNSRDVAATVSTLCDLGPELTPGHYGYTEPLLQRFDRSKLSEMGKGMEDGSLLIIRIPAGRISMSSHVSNYRFGCLSVELQAGFDTARIALLVRDVGTLLRPILGFVHVLNEHDRDNDIRRRMRVDAYDGCSFGMFHKELDYGLPEFFWGMLFGAPYVSMFGWEKLKSTPAAIISEMGAGSLYLQLTDDPRDCEAHPAKVASARLRAKKHLNPAAFMHDRLDLTGLTPKLPFFDRLFARKRIVPRLVP